jgi:type II secretory pathway pseudopilin PulG
MSVGRSQADIVRERQRRVSWNETALCQSKRRGLSLIELLVVIATIGGLIALLLPAVQAARASARATGCRSNLRQLGLAMLQYCDLHGGRFPEFGHDQDDAHQSWIYTLKPYIESVDELRICPEDPQGDQRLRANSTSYVINDYIAADVRYGVRNYNKLKKPSMAIVLFEGSDQRSTDFRNEHAHASEWFSAVNQRMGLVTWQIERDIQLARHFESTHFLFADAHLEIVPAEQIHSWIDQGYDFARPNRQPMGK